MTDHDLFGYGPWEPTFDPCTQCARGNRCEEDDTEEDA